MSTQKTTRSLPYILISEIAALIEDSDDKDVSVKVGQDNDVKIFTAHSIILRARSRYFKVALSHSWIRKENGIISMDKPNIRPIIFEKILRYIYTGDITLTLENDDILDILIAADEMILEALIKSILDYIISEGMDWIKENIVKVQRVASSLEACKTLSNKCNEIMKAEPEIIFKSKSYLTIEKDFLLDLLKRNDLDMKEIEIWDLLVKWGIAQSDENLSLDNIKNWSADNKQKLQTTLKDCITHIRFFQINSEDYYLKVYPFKYILPSQLKKDLKAYYLAPKLYPKEKLEGYAPKRGKDNIKMGFATQTFGKIPIFETSFGELPIYDYQTKSEQLEKESEEKEQAVRKVR
ncbi:4379_t:CDS:2, partial [Ambispora leptoticha]